MAWPSLLLDAGEALTAADFGDDGTRTAAFRALLCVHQLNVAHLDLSRRHFRKDVCGRVRLIDYSDSAPEATESDKNEDLATFEKLVRPAQEAPFSTHTLQQLMLSPLEATSNNGSSNPYLTETFVQVVLMAHQNEDT